MSLSNPHPPIWQQLAQAIHQQRCVLVLGSGACCDFEEQSVPMSSRLATHLSEQIKKHKDDNPLIDDENLSHVAKVFEDTPFDDKRFNDRKARQHLSKAIDDFYDTHKDLKFGFYEELVKMPFHIIINSSHYDFLEKAYKRVGKGVQEHYFHYDHSDHNGNLNFAKPTKRSPLLYNLFGSIEDTQSLVITETDKIRFVETIMQGEPEASLPTDLRSLLKGEGLTFLFMGFDFEEWHLRILLHVLELDKQDATIALQNPDNINKFTQFLYEKHFFVNFHNGQELDFIRKLDEALKRPQQAEKPEHQKDKQLFIMYDERDKQWRDDLEEHFAMKLRHNNTIGEIWHEGKLQAGDVIDKTIAQRIDEADIILLLVTQSFLASDKLYENQLAQALARHDNNEVCIIPLLMSPCDWEAASFASLFTILPRDTQPISKKDDKSETLKKTVEEINEIINHYWT